MHQFVSFYLYPNPPFRLNTNSQVQEELVHFPCQHHPRSTIISAKLFRFSHKHWNEQPSVQRKTGLSRSATRFTKFYHTKVPQLHRIRLTRETSKGPFLRRGDLNKLSSTDRRSSVSYIMTPLLHIYSIAGNIVSLDTRTRRNAFSRIPQRAVISIFCENNAAVLRMTRISRMHILFCFFYSSFF